MYPFKNLRNILLLCLRVIGGWNIFESLRSVYAQIIIPIHFLSIFFLYFLVNFSTHKIWFYGVIKNEGNFS